VPFFTPIVKELENRGHLVTLTVRDCFQVCGLSDYYKLDYKKIGRHYGKNKLLKVLGTVWRSLQLAPTVLREKPDLSVSHGSRSLIILSSLLSIPTVLIFDYEHSARVPFCRPMLGIAPKYIKNPDAENYFRSGVRKYAGLKEDVYVHQFTPDPSILRELDLDETRILATIRPPATEAHYHNPKSESLFVAVVDYLGTFPELQMVILPRNEVTQTEFIKTTWSDWCRSRKIVIPDHVVDGLNLIWHSDFVVSGGGTMNREAAALNVPVYSIFRGKIGAVDRYLEKNGRLTLLQNPEDVKTKVSVTKRNKKREPDHENRQILMSIVDSIEECLNESR
jgi:predicted glycosyltransferase